ncbi:MAG: hypothetical protein ABI590_03400 [Ilumatobacteraceae bacterium]
MSTHRRIYESMLWLYPRDFRRNYGDDLVQNFADLLGDRGIRSTWARTSVDLIVTVPRYRLESIMSEEKSAATINLALAVLSVGGMLALTTGIYPITVVFWIAAIALAFVQRGALARAIRTPSTNRRRKRIRIAAVLSLVCAAALFSYFVDLNDEKISTASLLIHNAIGNTAMIGAIVYLIAGLLTPRSSATSRTT